jgi:hypothetical protein
MDVEGANVGKSFQPMPGLNHFLLADEDADVFFSSTTYNKVEITNLGELGVAGRHTELRDASRHISAFKVKRTRLPMVSIRAGYREGTVIQRTRICNPECFRMFPE